MEMMEKYGNDRKVGQLHDLKVKPQHSEMDLSIVL